VALLKGGDVTDHLRMLAAICSPDGAQGLAGMLAALFLAGLAGSAVHCSAMCGPFVLSQSAGALARIPAAGLCERHRVASGLLLPYHAGRLLTYAALGAVGAGAGALAGVAPWLGVVPSVLLGLAGVLFVDQAIRRLAPGRYSGLAVPVAGGLRRWISATTRRIGQSGARGGFLLGLVLGLLPCGFLYAAIAAASATASPWRGALCMLAFGLGTVPVLVLTAIAGQAAARNWSATMAAIGPALLLLNGTMLIGLAGLRMLG
jgi:sulfite exporter TauE/SafE